MIHICIRQYVFWELVMIKSICIFRVFSKIFVLYSTHQEGKTFSKNHKSQLNNYLGKWQQNFSII